jgi:hypothetical protein
MEELLVKSKALNERMRQLLQDMKDYAEKCKEQDKNRIN